MEARFHDGAIFSDCDPDNFGCHHLARNEATTYVSKAANESQTNQSRRGQFTVTRYVRADDEAIVRSSPSSEGPQDERSERKTAA